MTKFFFGFSIILIITLTTSNSYSIQLNNPMLFLNEICSYNGIPKIDNISKEIKCVCFDGYDTVDESKTINGVPIQCNYQRRRRFIALFLSVFVPLGVDYLYLGNYWAFCIIILTVFFVCIGNCYLLIESQHDMGQNKEEKNRNLFQDQISFTKTRIIFLILGGLLIIFYIANIILIATGVIKDGNGISTINDLSYLYKLFY